MEFNTGEIYIISHGLKQEDTNTTILSHCIEFSSQMTLIDCVEMGLHAYTQHDFYQTILWMQQALIHYRKDPLESQSIISLDYILMYLSFATYYMG